MGQTSESPIRREKVIVAERFCGSMRVLIVHNNYRIQGGEEYLVQSVGDVLRCHGAEVVEFRKRHTTGAREAVSAFFTGLGNRSVNRELEAVIAKASPSHAFIGNLYPTISPAALGPIRRAGVPIVMNVQNFRLACPNGLHYSHGEICTRCLGGKEYWCVLRNCERSLLKSTGYALRNAVARWTGGFTDNVDVFTPPTSFHARWLVSQGIEADRIHVIPNMVDDVAGSGRAGGGDYVGFAGRVSPEKGVGVLLDAARRLPAVPFRIAGSFERMPALPASAPANVRFLGHLGPQDLSDFYANARMVVVPSVWFEGFPTVIPQAMLRARPVVASDVGGLADVITDGVTGYLFPMGDACQLADRINAIWSDATLAESMGVAAREQAVREYSRERYYERLMGAFAAAKARRTGTPPSTSSSP
jgi:glycosyltransferase involved in cell wall biosynthesis